MLGCSGLFWDFWAGFRGFGGPAWAECDRSPLHARVRSRHASLLAKVPTRVFEGAPREAPREPSGVAREHTGSNGISRGELRPTVPPWCIWEEARATRGGIMGGLSILDLYPRSVAQRKIYSQPYGHASFVIDQTCARKSHDDYASDWKPGGCCDLQNKSRQGT